MLETFKARLKAKTKATGVNLSQKRIDAIADRLHKKFPDLTEEAAHDEQLDVLYSDDDFKEMASLDDYNRTKEAKEKKDKEIKDAQQKEASEKKEEPTDDTPAWAKSIIESNKTLTEKLNRIEAEKTQATMKDKVAAHEKLKNIPKSFYELIPLPEKEDELDSFADRVVEKHTAYTQEAGVTTPVQRPIKSGGSTGDTPSEKEVDTILDKM